MGSSKTELFTDSQNDLALAAKALAHPARIAIIQYLLKSDACINGDLVNELGLAQATISQHLKELKEIGIIQGSIDGTRISYCINPIRWKELESQFNSLFKSYTPFSKRDCC